MSPLAFPVIEHNNALCLYLPTFFSLSLSRRYFSVISSPRTTTIYFNMDWRVGATVKMRTHLYMALVDRMMHQLLLLLLWVVGIAHCAHRRSRGRERVTIHFLHPYTSIKRHMHGLHKLTKVHTAQTIIVDSKLVTIKLKLRVVDRHIQLVNMID